MEDVPVFTRGPLRSRPFRCGRGGETLSMVGDASYQIVFVSLDLSISHSPAALCSGARRHRTAARGVLLLIGAQPRTSSHPAQSGLSRLSRTWWAALRAPSSRPWPPRAACRGHP